MYHQTATSDVKTLLQINVTGCAMFAREFTPAMVKRGRGGVVIVSSLTSACGCPGALTAYAASKSFQVIFAEGLWGELAPLGVDVLCPILGATLSETYLRRNVRNPGVEYSPRDMVLGSLPYLGRQPTVVPGALNYVSQVVMGLLPRNTRILLMGRVSARGIPIPSADQK
eukprot:TRINITY_DN6196_c0_g1_i2.p2 TRINITY_DN6196_c0_g1~~TRINITY_DN6196_c0_g1_i2.p2  ORF type:complete len:170 (+),score=24.67 TRINITY_DN6196_c0_g1_i2:905-1414(+)